MEKTAYTADLTATIASKNILRLYDSDTTTSTTSSSPSVITPAGGDGPRGRGENINEDPRTASLLSAAPNPSLLLRYPEDLPRWRSLFLSPPSRHRPRASPLPPPTVACVSLYKWDGVLQMNGLLLTGFLAAITKVMIELFQLKAAVVGGSRVWLRVWIVMETIMTFLVATFF